MRIALFSWESLHSILVGGVAFHVSELACGLERKGHEVHLFTRVGKPGQSPYERIDGVHYHRCTYEQHPDIVQDVSAMCRSFVDAFFATEAHISRFDVVHAHDWLAAQAMTWINQRSPHTTVFTMHSTEYGRCGNQIHGGRAQQIADIERMATHDANKVIAVSVSLKNETARLYAVPAGKIKPIYNGICHWNYSGSVDAASVKARYGVGAMDPLVVFVGRMTSQKGPDLLVDAVPQVVQSNPNAKFIMAGEGDLREYVEERARELGVMHAMRFFGYLDRGELIDIYKSCDCVCVPSRNEPFGIVVLESWSAGKPVVATASGGPAEIVWHGVTGYKTFANANSIAHGITTLFADFDHARWMGHNGRVAVESSFSWDVIAEQTLEVYGSGNS